MILTNRIKILLSIVALLSVAAWFTVKENSTVSTFEEDLAIAIKDTASVSEVSFYSQKGSGVLKKDKNGIWIINDKYPARTQLSDLLLFGITKLEIRRPVSEENRQNVLQKLENKGIRVVVKEMGGEHVFRVLSNENDPNSSYFVKEDGQNPFITYVPGFTGNISNLLTLSENDWRSRTLFASDHRSLQSISVNYPKASSNNFSIKYQEGSFNVDGLAPVDTMMLVSYLQNFAMVNVSGFVDNPDSLRTVFSNLEPTAVIKVEDMMKERSNELVIYKRQDEKYWLGLVSGINEPVLLKDELVERLLPVKKDFEYKSR